MAKGDIKINIAPPDDLGPGDLTITGPIAFIDKMEAALGATHENFVDWRCSRRPTNFQRLLGQKERSLSTSQAALERALATELELKNQLWVDAVTIDGEGKVISQDPPFIR